MVHFTRSGEIDHQGASQMVYAFCFLLCFYMFCLCVFTLLLLFLLPLRAPPDGQFAQMVHVLLICCYAFMYFVCFHSFF